MSISGKTLPLESVTQAFREPGVAEQSVLFCQTATKWSVVKKVSTDPIGTRLPEPLMVFGV
jgi:hypothetical protein